MVASGCPRLRLMAAANGGQRPSRVLSQSVLWTACRAPPAGGWPCPERAGRSATSGLTHCHSHSFHRGCFSQGIPNNMPRGAETSGYTVQRRGSQSCFRAASPAPRGHHRPLPGVKGLTSLRKSADERPRRPLRCIVSSPRLVEALSSLLVRWHLLQPPLPVPSCPELLPSPSLSSPEHCPPPVPTCRWTTRDSTGAWQRMRWARWRKWWFSCCRVSLRGPGWGQREVGP